MIFKCTFCFFLCLSTGFTNEVLFTADNWKLLNNIEARKDNRKKQTNYFINPQFMQLATVNYGQFPLHVENKILNGICLNFVLFGGSISCGECAEANKTNPSCPGSVGHPHLNVFSSYFFELINQSWPCKPGEPTEISLPERNPELPFNSYRFFGSNNSHRFDNLCQSGAASDYHLNRLIEARGTDSNLDRVIRSADIIIIESSVNDVVLRNRPKGVEYFGEMFYRYFNSMDHAPAMMYLSVSNKGALAHNEEQRLEDVTPQLLNVSKYFNIPHLSILDGFGVAKSRTSKHFDKYIYRADWCHPSVLGHRIVASALYQYMVNYRISLNYPIYSGVHLIENRLNYSAKPMKYCTINEFNDFIQGSPLVINLINSGTSLINNTGWTVVKDAPNKFWFCAYTLNSSFVYYLYPVDLEKLHVGKLVVTFLKSYQHMGTFRVTLSRQCYNYLYEESFEFDSLWSHKSSQISVETFRFELDEGMRVQFCYLDGFPVPPAYLTVQITQSTPHRILNRIKLVSISLY